MAPKSGSLMSQVLQAALRYAELGYAVFPCAAGLNPAPLTPHGFKDASVDPDEIEAWWERFPEATIGLATGGLLVVDVDGSGNPWLAGDYDKATALAAAPTSLTPGGGRHDIFRRPAGKVWTCTVGQLAEDVDVRTDGGYIVVPPSVRIDGSYRWLAGAELDAPIDRLPEPPAWLAEALDALAEDRRPRIATGSPTLASVALGELDANPIPDGQRNATLARLAGAMRRVGMSRDEIDAAIQRVNEDRCRPPLSPAEVGRIAASVARYRPDEVSTAFVEDHWTQDRGGDEPPGDASPTDPGAFPDHLMRVPGFIDDVVQYNLATANRPQPVLALAGAIVLQAVLAARKVRDERGNRTNLYVVSIADSGAGKEHARKVGKRVLYAAGLERLDGNDEVASDAGLVSAAELEPACLFQIDEFGRFLRTIGDPKKAPHLFNTIGTFMKLYSCADSMFRGKAYADAKRNRTIDQPCVCLHGTSVPEHFYESLTADSLSDGFVARLLVFESHEIPDRQRRAETPVPEAIAAAARWWGEYEPGGNLRREHPQPAVVPTTPDGAAIFDEFATKFDAELRERRGVGASLWARAEEKACRLALVYACSVDHEQPVIDADAARWAGELSEYLTRRVLRLAAEWVSDGRFDAQQKKLLRIIREAGGEIGRRELSRRSQWLSQRERNEIVANLIEAGLVETRRIETSTRPKEVYACR